MESYDENIYLPSVSVDAVIFSFKNGELKVLLREYKGGLKRYGLPGGFVGMREGIDAAAYRVVHEAVGVQGVPLFQFHTFGSMERYHRETMAAFLYANNIPYTNEHWLLKRFISVGYYALADFSKVTITPGQVSESCDWYDVSQLPEMLWDHTGIVRKAIETLRKDIDSKLLSVNLLPEYFTMGELQLLYESIMGKTYIRSGFQRKMLSLGILERVEKKSTGHAYRSPYLYRFITKA